MFFRFLLNGGNTRIPIEQFHIALKHSGLDNDIAETECFLANMIYKVTMFIFCTSNSNFVQGFMKGYIHQERQMIILSLKDPFPRAVKLHNLY